MDTLLFTRGSVAVYAASTALEALVGHPLPSRHVRAQAATPRHDRV